MERSYFITNRNLVSVSKRPWFGTKLETSQSNIRIGWTDLDLTAPDPAISAVYVSPESKRASGDTPIGKRIAPKFSLFKEVQGKMKANVPDTILFIHGFDYKFDEALVGLGRLRQRLTLGAFPAANMVAFTWPSNGEMIPFISYASDRRDAKASGEAGGRALLQLSDFLARLAPKDICRGRIHIVAHSMGNYVLRNALQALLKNLPVNPPTLFDEVLLIAADEDFDALELDYKLQPIAAVAKRVHVYYNPSDIALDISRDTKGNPRRLGSRGPRNSSAIPDTVVLVDASNVSRWSDSDWDYHHYYLHAPEMAADMAAVLLGVPEDKIAGRIPLPGRRGSFRLHAV